MEDENRSLSRRQKDISRNDYGVYPSDEISLYDIWDILIRRIWWIVGVSAGVVLLALVYALSSTTSYQYTSVIEMGGMPDQVGSDRFRYLESDSAFLQRLTNVFVPTARESLEESNAELSIPRVSVTRGEGGALFLLNSTVSQNQHELVDALHRNIISQATESHQVPYRQARLNRIEQLAQAKAGLEFQQDPRVQRARVRPLEQAVLNAELDLDVLRSHMDIHRLGVENRLRALQLSLADRKVQRELLQAQQRRLDEQRKLTEAQIEKANAFSERMSSGASVSLLERGANNVPDGMVELFLSTQTDQARRRVDELEGRLLIDLPERADTVASSLEENRREQELQKAAISEVKAELEQLVLNERQQTEMARAELESAQAKLAREQANLELEIRGLESEVSLADGFLDQVSLTRATRVAVRSLEPTGTGKSLILALGLVLGGMLGIFAAFAAEFVSNARNRRRMS